MVDKIHKKEKYIAIVFSLILTVVITIGWLSKEERLFWFLISLVYLTLMICFIMPIITGEVNN